MYNFVENESSSPYSILYSPLLLSNVRKDLLWRRTWRLYTEKKLRRHILHKSSIILQYENTYSVHLSVSSEVKHRKICQSSVLIWTTFTIKSSIWYKQWWGNLTKNNSRIFFLKKNMVSWESGEDTLKYLSNYTIKIMAKEVKSFYHFFQKITYLPTSLSTPISYLSPFKTLGNYSSESRLILFPPKNE